MNKKELVSAQEAVDKANAKAQSFIDGIVDDDSFVETDAFVLGSNGALGEGVVTGYATIEGTPVHIFAQNADVMMGSIGAACAKKIAKCMERACKTGTPLISVLDCSGARVDEGTAVMEAYASLLAMAEEVGETVPHICIVKGVAVGMTATFAAMADYVFMSKDAILSVNSPMYLASTQTSIPKLNKMVGYDAYKSGTSLAGDVYSSAKDLKGKLVDLLSTIGVIEKEASGDDPNRVVSALTKKYSVSGALQALADDGKYIELNADYAKDVVCAFAKVNGISVAVLANESSENDGYMSEEGIKKASAFIKKANAFGLPLITLVDCKGFNPDLKQELSGFALKTACLFKAVASYEHPMIGVACGNAIGAAYSALMSKGVGFDYTLATTAAVVSPVTSDTGVHVFMTEELKQKKGVGSKTVSKLEQQYNDEMGNPITAASEGFIDNVIEAGNLRPCVSSALLMLLGI